MPEPGVSEIINFNADPERGTGTPAVTYDSTELIRTLNNAAQYKAENDWRKYTTFMGNLKEVYKDLNEIAKQDVLTEDRDKLKANMAEIIKGISSDPRGFFGGGAKYQETLGRIAQLQTEATESKQNSLYDKAHRAYFYANPELDTPENRALLDGFRKQPLGARQPYMMKLPGLFDPKAVADQLNLISKEDYSDEKLTPDQQNFEKISGTRYNPEKYRNTADAFYNDADKRGIPLRETLTKRYDMLPDYAKEKYKGQQDPVKAWYLDLMDSYRLQGSEKKELQANPNYLKKDELAARERDSRRDYSATTRGQTFQMWAQGFMPDGKGGFKKDAQGNWEKAPWAKDWSRTGGTEDVDQYGEPIKKGDYWANVITPQLNNFGKLQNAKAGLDKSSGGNGDIEVTWADISGLEMALHNEKTNEGTQFSVMDNDGVISGRLQPKIRFKDGKPIGVVIGDKFYNSENINAKAIDARNKSMSQRTDSDPYNQ